MSFRRLQLPLYGHALVTPSLLKLRQLLLLPSILGSARCYYRTILSQPRRTLLIALYFIVYSYEYIDANEVR